MAHVRADKIDKGGISLLPHRRWIEWRQTPVLTTRVENIGRRSNKRIRNEVVRRAPCFGTGAIAADCHVTVKPKAKTAAAERVLDPPQLALRDPLQPAKKLDLVLQLAGRLAHLIGGGILIRRWPAVPVGSPRADLCRIGAKRLK